VSSSTACGRLHVFLYRPDTGAGRVLLLGRASSQKLISEIVMRYLCIHSFVYTHALTHIHTHTHTHIHTYTHTQGGICRGGGKKGFSPSLLHDIPGTGWSLAISSRDTIYPMHSIYASNYPPHPLHMRLTFHESKS